MYKLTWKFSNGKTGSASFSYKLTKGKQAIWIVQKFKKDLIESNGNVVWKFAPTN